MAVIRPDIATDPAELEQIAFEYLEAALPNWQRSEGDLMSWLISAHAPMVAEERDVAADVPFEQILRPLGEKVHGIVPRAAVPATVSAYVFMRDGAGYTVPAGLEVLVRTSGDDGVTMAVVETVTVKPFAGTPANDRRELRAEVQLRAVYGREGEVGNDLDGSATVVPLQALEFIDYITLTDTSAGGVDAETDEEYFQRLVDTLALTSQVPVLTGDFAALAKQHPKVGRAIAFNRQLWRPEILEVTSTGSASLTMPGLPYEIPLALNATAADVTAAIARAGLTGSVRAPAADSRLSGTVPFTLTLSGRASYGPWQLRTTSGLGSVKIVQLGGERAGTDHAVTVAVATEAGDALATTERDEVQALLESKRELNWKISVVNPTERAIHVAADVVTWPSYDATVSDAVKVALRAFLSPARWGSGEQQTGDVWVEDLVVRYLEVAQAINEVTGVRYITNLRIGTNPLSLGTSDILLDGLAPLPSAGELTVNVTRG